MDSIRSLIFGLVVLAGCYRVDGWKIDRIEERWNSTEPKEDSVRFTNGKIWENVGMKVEKVAMISGPADSRAIGFRALSCVECEADLLLTIRSSVSDQILAEPYPGKMTEVDAKSGVAELAPYAEVRAYYGNCVSGEKGEVFLLDFLAVKEGTASRKQFTPTAKGLETKRSPLSPSGFREFRPPQRCREILGMNRDVDS